MYIAESMYSNMYMRMGCGQHIGDNRFKGTSIKAE